MTNQPEDVGQDPTTGPEPADAGWPGPSGLGGPGSEELPATQGTAPPGRRPEADRVRRAASVRTYGRSSQ